MIRYCLEIQTDAALIHRLDCGSYDLGTLLGLGCLVDLGEFRSSVQALEDIKRTHPDAQRCRECCQAEVMYLPHIAQPALQEGIVLISG